MEIKSFKVNPTLSSSEKRIEQHQQDLTDAVSQSNEDAISTKKKLIVQKPPVDDARNKAVRVKPRGVAASKTNKRKAPSSQELKTQSKPDSLNEFRENERDNEAAKRQELEDMIEAMDPNYDNKRKALQEVQFIFDSKLHDSNVPYHQEGNMEFYTKENEKKREALKSEPKVIEALNDVINLYPFDSDGMLYKEGYSKLHSQIAKMMRKDLKDKALGRLVEQDWKHDSKDKGYMTKKELFDSLFELGDVWTPEINVHQYVAFFQQLRKKLAGKENSSKIKSDDKENPYSIL